MAEESAEPERIGIMAEPTPNPASFKFTVDRPLLPEYSVHFSSVEETEGSELPRLLFDRFEDVTGVFVSDNIVTITKSTLGNWISLAREVGPAIREAIRSGKTLVAETAKERSKGSTEIEKKIIAILDRIRPSVQLDGGDIVFAGFQEGVVSVSMRGSCAGCPSSSMTLKMGIETQLKQEIPEVRELVQI